MEIRASAVRIEPWCEDDLDLLRAANAPELMGHLGGSEPEEKLIARHRRYVALSADRTGRGRMYRVVAADTGEAVGTIGFWEQSWQGHAVYETGWAVLPRFQGRGVATSAALAVADAARAERRYRFLHAFPKLENGPSNAVCRKAGFELMGACAIEYPPGNPITSNDWRLDLEALPPRPPQ
ncbi:GNAT family N-acetyltransferase [Streptomyces sp. NPDC004726]